MMEHIRNFDWCDSSHLNQFVSERGLDNCVTERILRNRFIDPFVSSDSENEDSQPKVNWNEVFKKRNNYNNQKYSYVPCCYAIPPYPKLSSLTIQQHIHCLKVISMQCPNVMPGMFVKKPNQFDYKIYEEVKSNYAKEQTEYIEWAKSLWPKHCIRALRPKQHIETMYEATFKMRANSLQSFPKKYIMAAQIVLEAKDNNFQIVHKEDLISIDVQELPQIKLPDLTSKFTVKQPLSPEPCLKHPCHFMLPGEKEMTILPLTEVHRELAQYALDNRVQCIASESALKCIVETDQPWTIPISVCQIIGPDGDTSNVIVLGSQFSVEKQPAQIRTYKAYQHLLQLTLVTQSQNTNTTKRKRSNNESHNEAKAKKSNNETNLLLFGSDDDDSDDDNLFIIEDETPTKTTIPSKHGAKTDDAMKKKPNTRASTEDHSEFYKCTCKDTPFSLPPPRSYRKWVVKNYETGDHYDVIVHCAHKARDKTEEVILEPIPEYQMDLGGSLQSPEKIKSLALSLHLRNSPTLVNVRIESGSGEVAAVEISPWEQFMARQAAPPAPSPLATVANRLYTTIDQLQGLLPGHYLLQHQVNHGTNALLYAARSDGKAQLVLNFDLQSAAIDETANLKVPPTLSPVLLPYHKLRRILPCAFTPYEHQVKKEKKPIKEKQNKKTKKKSKKNKNKSSKTNISY